MYPRLAVMPRFPYGTATFPPPAGPVFGQVRALPSPFGIDPGYWIIGSGLALAALGHRTHHRGLVWLGLGIAGVTTAAAIHFVASWRAGGLSDADPESGPGT